MVRLVVVEEALSEVGVEVGKWEAAMVFELIQCLWYPTKSVDAIAVVVPFN